MKKEGELENRERLFNLGTIILFGVFLIIGILIFLFMKGINFFINLVVKALSFLIYELLIAFNFMYIASESRTKEVLVVD